MAAGGDDGGRGPAAADPTAAPPFGAQLRRARRAAGLTQEELAERARLSARAVSDLERGAKRAPRPDTLRRLAAALRLAPAARAALAAAAARPAAAPPGGMVVPPGPRHNLPAPLTSFVGRERELAAVRERLLDPRVRLLTLTGPGGVGKTRLALEAAAGVLGAAGAPYPDGAWLVELAALAEPALVAQTVVAAFGVRADPGRPLLAALTDALRSRRLLLVLDNCEHVVAACAALADALLRACPQVRLLATSREPLGLAGETVWRVPSLSVPAAGGARPDAAPAPGDLARSAAVRLFCERAAAVRPGFALDAESAPAVAQICVRLDGLPLALELAAARVRVLPPLQLRARLEDRFRLLTGGSRAALARHRTLRAAVDWSHALLTAPERALFARLAVFAGGFSLEAAEAVGADRPDGPEGPDRGGIEAPEVLDLLTRLVDQSLVLAEAAPGGAARYRLLETLRQYAGERLAAGGGREAAGRCHAGYFLGLAERAAEAMRGPDQGAWFDRLERDRDNLRAALRWLLDQDDPDGLDGAVRLAWALRWFWDIRGHPTEGRTWLAETLAHRHLAASSARRAQALAAAGQMARADGTYGEARHLLTESVALFQQRGDERGAAAALRELGRATFRGVDGDRAAGLAAVEQSLAVFRRLGDRWQLAESLNACGCYTRDLGDYGAAERAFEECLALYRAVGDRCGEGGALQAMANLALRQGEYAAALARAEESLATSRALGDRPRVASALHTLSLVAQALGDAPLARRHLEAQLAVAQQADVTPMVVLAAYRLAALAAARGDDGQAGQLYLLCLRRCAQRALRQGTIACLAGLAAVALARGQPEPAARLLGAAEAGRAGAAGFLETTPFGRSQLGQTAASARAQFEQTVAAVRRGLTGRSGAETWIAEGRRLPLERAVEEAVALAEGGAAAGREPLREYRGAARGDGYPLTAREQEVAALVARGLTNRRIAAELGITERTAGTHLERIMHKLGAHSRAEVAAWVVGRRPAAAPAAPAAPDGTG